MTGYGMGEYENEEYRFKIEIKTVNHRYNDISIRMPRYISYLEEDLKKKIKVYVKRGKVDVFVNLEYVSDSPIDIKVDIPLAKSYKLALENLKEELEIEDSIRLNNILNIPDIIKFDKKEVDDGLISESLFNAMDIALNNLDEMRSSEGESLKEDMLLKLEEAETKIKAIEERAPIVVIEYRGKLEDRIKELLDKDVSIDKERLSTEIAILADKASIDEEVVRLKSHINQFRLIFKEGDAIGRKLDFLIQEFNREINTIGSKSSDVSISNNVVDLKSIIEKIREQIQNIE